MHRILQFFCRWWGKRSRKPVHYEFQEHFFEALKQKGIENYDRAVESLHKCLNLDSKKPVIYFELGKNYNKLKNFGAAEENLKKAINMQPDNEWFLDELYDVYFQQDDAVSRVVAIVSWYFRWTRCSSSCSCRWLLFLQFVRLQQWTLGAC